MRHLTMETMLSGLIILGVGITSPVLGQQSTMSGSGFGQANTAGNGSFGQQAYSPGNGLAAESGLYGNTYNGQGNYWAQHNAYSGQQNFNPYYPYGISNAYTRYNTNQANGVSGTNYYGNQTGNYFGNQNSYFSTNGYGSPMLNNYRNRGVNGPPNNYGNFNGATSGNGYFNNVYGSGYQNQQTGRYSWYGNGNGSGNGTFSNQSPTQPQLAE